MHPLIKGAHNTSTKAKQLEVLTTPLTKAELPEAPAIPFCSTDTAAAAKELENLLTFIGYALADNALVKDSVYPEEAAEGLQQCITIARQIAGYIAEVEVAR